MRRGGRESALEPGANQPPHDLRPVILQLSGVHVFVTGLVAGCLFVGAFVSLCYRWSTGLDFEGVVGVILGGLVIPAVVVVSSFWSLSVAGSDQSPLFLVSLFVGAFVGALLSVFFIAKARFGERPRMRLGPAGKTAEK